MPPKRSGARRGATSKPTVSAAPATSAPSRVELPEVITVVTQVDLTSWVSQLKGSEDKPIDLTNPRFAQPAEQLLNGGWAMSC